MHTIGQSPPSGPSIDSRESAHMKARIVEPAEDLELVPQILHLNKILVPTDFSATSQKAFHYALRFAEQFGCEIVLLHVVEPVRLVVGAPLAVEVFPEPEDDSIAARKALAAIVTKTRASGAEQLTSEVRRGHAPNEIIKAAKDLDVDLIVIATHGYTSWKHLCIGSTAERVVRAAPCPVLVVREKEHEFC
jgi:nucleotide-binding universal stress UspA family protein